MSRKATFLLFIIFLSISMLMFVSGCRDYIPFIAEEKEKKEPPSPEETMPEDEDEMDEKEEIPEDMLPITVYFLEGKGRYLIPVTIPISWTESVGQASVDKLIEGPTPAQEMRFGFTSPVPPTAEVKGLNIREGLARINLSSSFLEYDPGEEREVLDSVIFTLQQFPTVDEVEFLIEGEVIEEFPGGTPGGITFTEERGVNLEVEEDIDLDDSRQVVLYFCVPLGEENIFYVPVTRVVDGEENNIEAALRELLEGPAPESGLFSDIPPRTQVQDISLKEGKLQVDFSQEILEYQGGRTGEENIKQQLVLTLTEIDQVETVHILIEGEERILPEGTSLEDPLRRPEVVNYLPAD